MFPYCGGEEEVPCPILIWAKKEIGYSLLVYLSSKLEVEMEEPISHLPKN